LKSINQFLKIFNIVLFLFGLSLMAYFAVAGTTIDEDGVLIEEFWAWGLGVLMVILSLVGFLIWGISFLINRRNQ
jgi:hypothetical protein